MSAVGGRGKSSNEAKVFTVVQQPAHPDGRGDTLPPTACLVETSFADLNRRDW